VRSRPIGRLAHLVGIARGCVGFALGAYAASIGDIPRLALGWGCGCVLIPEALAFAGVWGALGIAAAARP